MGKNYLDLQNNYTTDRKEKLVDIYGSVDRNYKNILVYAFFNLRH